MCGQTPPRGGGENLSYSAAKVADNNNNKKVMLREALRSKKNTSCCGLRSKKTTSCCTELRTAKKICHAVRNERSECSRSTHSSPLRPTANAAPTSNISPLTAPKQVTESTGLQMDTATVLRTAQHDVKKNTVLDDAYSGKEALDQIERKLDQRLRIAATHFANNTAQGLVQRSLPQRLLGGHWLREKFQFLSTLAWQTGDDEGGILGELDLVVPLYGKRNAAGVDQYGFFLQPGLVSWEADNGDRRLDVNVGLAYRHRVRERIAVGAAVFYDHNIDSDLKRIGAAADMVSPYTYLAVNYYEPLDGWRTGERLGYEERVLRGVDINVEQALWDSHWVLEASGGYWKGYDADNRQGEWQLAGSVGIRYYPLDYLSVYADYAYQHEDVDTDRFAAGVEFSYPGKYRGVSENEIDLWRPVKREKRTLYAEREKRMIPINADTGTGTPTLTLASDPADTAGGGAISLLVTSNIAISGTLTLPLTISGQVAAGDFTGGLTQSVTANFNGATTATVTIATVKDRDTLETYTIMLGSGSGYIVGSDSTAAGRITMALPVLTLVTDPSAVDPGNAISLVITSDEVITGTLTLPLTISDRAASGLVAGYFTGGLTQSVNANFNGSTTATVTIATARLGGTAKTYTITLGSGSVYTVGVGSDSTAAGTINALTPTLTLGDPVTEVRNGADIVLLIISDIVVADTLTVALTIRGSGITFRADAADFTNGLSQSLRVDIVDGLFGITGLFAGSVRIGTVNDGDTRFEDYTITLNAGSNYQVGSTNQASGSIAP